MRHKPDNATGESRRVHSHRVVALATALGNDQPRRKRENNPLFEWTSILEETIPAKLCVELTWIGEASNGNWFMPIKHDAEYAVRNLNGSMDEFIIFSVALCKKEILEICENGKP